MGARPAVTATALGPSYATPTSRGPPVETGRLGPTRTPQTRGPLDAGPVPLQPPEQTRKRKGQTHAHPEL